MAKRALRGVFVLASLSLHATVHAMSSDRCGRFQGLPIANALQFFGSPDSSYTFPNGAKVFTWNRTAYDQTTDVGDAMAFSRDRACRIAFTTDLNDTIAGCQYDGRCQAFQNF